MHLVGTGLYSLRNYLTGKEEKQKEREKEKTHRKRFKTLKAENTK